MYNEVVKKFFIYHEIDPDKISEKLDTRIHTTPEYLGPFSDSMIFDFYEMADVSIADIYGCDTLMGIGNVSVF